LWYEAKYNERRYSSLNIDLQTVVLRFLRTREMFLRVSLKKVCNDRLFKCKLAKGKQYLLYKQTGTEVNILYVTKEEKDLEAGCRNGAEKQKEIICTSVLSNERCQTCYFKLH